MFNYEASVERLKGLDPNTTRELYNQTFRGITEEEALEAHRVFMIMLEADADKDPEIEEKIKAYEDIEEKLAQKYGKIEP